MADGAHKPAEPKDYRIAVIGSGAVGCYYGGRLAWRHRDVHFLMRGDAPVVRQKGLRVRSHHGDFHVPGVKVHETTTSIGPVDLVIIALKATQNHSLLHHLPPLLHPGTVLLTLQNGLGSDDFLAQHFGASRVVGGLCFVCINRTAPGEIWHSAQGKIGLGNYQDWPTPWLLDLAYEFKHCAIQTQVVADLEQERWKKLCWNIPFNGLSIAGAPGGLTTDKIMDDPALLDRVRRLMVETLLIAEARGKRLPASLIDVHLQATKIMAAYRTSSLIDFQEGREVEIDAIWNEPIQRAKALGLHVPEMESLLAEIRDRIQSR